jgi:predicted nucleic acid-binding protein
MPGSFLDSNVILHLASGEHAKADCAEELVAQGGTISIQVLNEVANVSRRKMKMSWPETRTFLITIRELLNVESITIGTHETGIDLAEQYGLSVYDGMIVAAALLANCDTLFSEDLQDGLLIRGRLRVVNPFALTR